MEPQPGVLASVSAAASALKEVRHPKIRRAITLYTLGMAGWSGTLAFRNWHESRYAYTVTIDSRVELYEDVAGWLVKELPMEEVRSLYASKSRAAPVYDSELNEFKSPTELLLFYDGTKEQTIEIDGHKIRVAVSTDDDASDDKKEMSFRAKTKKIVFTAHSQEGQKAVTAHLQRITQKAEEDQRSPRFMMADKWGSWMRRNDLEARSLDTVILPEGQKEILVEDIGRFMRLKERYLKFGIPYHRGYLFEGPPGTGKTSLANALATHFNLDMYYIPLADMEKDASLMAMISNVPPGSVLLLEDVDVFKAARERDDSDDFGITLSGLLNSLDGVSTPSGLITIMTTNHAEVLDDAIVRPGRVDRVEHIGHLDDHQLARLVYMFLGHNDFKLPPLAGKLVTPAEVAEIVKRDLEDPEVAFKKLKKYLRKRK